MRLDQLKDAWLGDDEAGSDRCEAGDGHGFEGEDDSAAALEDARRRAAELAADVRRRDRRETIVAFLLIPVFLLFAFTATTTVQMVGALIVVAACAFIPVRLRAARRSEPDPGLPVIAAMRAELDHTRAQERLLGSVLLWYLGPMGLGLALYLGGGAESMAVRIGLLAMVGVLYAVIAWLNHRVVQKEIRPLGRALEKSIQELEEEYDA